MLKITVYGLYHFSLYVIFLSITLKIYPVWHPKSMLSNYSLMIFDIIELLSLFATLSLLSHGTVKKAWALQLRHTFVSGSKPYCLGNLFNLTKLNVPHLTPFGFRSYAVIFVSFLLLPPVSNTSLGWYWWFRKVKKLLIMPWVQILYSSPHTFFCPLWPVVSNHVQGALKGHFVPLSLNLSISLINFIV